MGVVYRARDPRISRVVAVKLLRVDNDDLRSRFEREARSAGNLTHANIVTIFDYGEHEGQPFIVMEYVQGQTLAQQIHDRVPLSVTAKLDFMDMLASGLGYAHRQGVIHRDVKPANLMIDRYRVLKILDFGIARVEDSGFTKAGMIVGTPNYMSPEQVEGRAVDARSDIFSVGTVFYELLAYRQAFSGDSIHGVLDRVLHREPEPLSVVSPGLDPGIQHIVAKALEKNPADRYQTLGQLRLDLSRCRASIAESEAEAKPTLGGTFVQRPAPVRTPRPGTSREELARRRAEQIESHLKTASEAFHAGDYEGAIAACESAALLDPDEPRALGLMDRAREALDRKKADELLVQAEVVIQRGEFGLADDLIEQALHFDPTSTTAVRVSRVLADARQRQARAALEERRLREEQARQERAERERLAREAAEAEWRRLEQERWLADRLAVARKAIDHRRFREAIETLEQLMNVRPDAAVADLLAEARRAHADFEANVQRERERADRVARARAFIGSGQLEAALLLLDRVVEAVPGDEEARRLQAEARTALDRVRAETREKARLAEEAAKQDREHAARAAEQERVRLREIAAERAAAERERLRLQRITDEQAAATIDGPVAPPRTAPLTPAAAPPAAAAAPPEPARALTRARSVPRLPIAIGLAAIVIVSIALGWRLRKPAQTVVTDVNVSDPASTRPPSPPPPAPPEPSVPPIARPSADDPAASLRDRFRASIAKGDDRSTLETLMEGLRVKPSDAEFAKALGEMNRKAEAAASQRREQAVAAEAPKLAKAEYERGLARLDEGGQLRRTQQGAAIRKFWDAADLFGKAAERASEAARTTVAPGGGGTSDSQAASRGELGAAVQVPAGKTGATEPGKETVTEQPRGTAQGGVPVPPGRQTEENKEAVGQQALVRQQALDRQAIEQTVDRYVAGYNSLDPAAVLSVSPTERSVGVFKEYLTLRMVLGGRTIDLHGDTATVKCVREIQIVTKNRGRQTLRSGPTPITISLRRSASSWLIDSIK